MLVLMLVLVLMLALESFPGLQQLLHAPSPHSHSCVGHSQAVKWLHTSRPVGNCKV